MKKDKRDLFELMTACDIISEKELKERSNELKIEQEKDKKDKK